MQKIFFYAGLAILLIVRSTNFGNVCCGGCCNNYLNVVILGQESFVMNEEEFSTQSASSYSLVHEADQKKAEFEVVSVISGDEHFPPSESFFPGQVSSGMDLQKNHVKWAEDKNTVHEYSRSEKKLFKMTNSLLWNINPVCGFKDVDNLDFQASDHIYENCKGDDSSSLDMILLGFAYKFRDSGVVNFKEVFSDLFPGAKNVSYVSVFSQESQDISKVDDFLKKEAVSFCKKIIKYFKKNISEPSFSIEDDIKHIFYIYSPSYRASLVHHGCSKESALKWEIDLRISFLKQECSYRRLVMLRAVYDFVDQGRFKDNHLFMLLTIILKSKKSKHTVLFNLSEQSFHSEDYYDKIECSKLKLKCRLPQLIFSNIAGEAECSLTIK